MKKKILPALLFALLISCSSRSYKKPLRDDGSVIKSLVILPVINKTTAADAPALYLPTLVEPLSNKGYYLYPLEITNEVFKKEGVVSGEQLEGVGPVKYRKLFGADAAVRVTIFHWDTSYLILSSSVTVSIKIEIVSCRTGKLLWSGKMRKTISPNQSSSSNLLATVITTAISTAATDYISIARQINRQVLSRLPAGPYHRLYSPRKTVN